MAYGTVEYQHLENYNDGLTPLQRKLQIAGAVIAVVIVISAIATTLAVLYGPSSKDDDNNNSQSTKLEDSMDIQNIMSYLNDFQLIANEHNGSRAPLYGYNASVDYIVNALKADTEWHVSVQNFIVYIVTVIAPSQLNQTYPVNQTYVNGNDFRDFQAYNGELLLEDQPVYVVPNLGCSSSDYADFPKDGNHMGLILRGNCTFAEKITLAMDNGATAALIYNDGTAPDRTGAFVGSTGGIASTIPAYGLSYSVGTTFRDTAGVRLSVFVNAVGQNVTTMNVIADTNFGSNTSVIVIGSHLDSVPAGPGINDNGSGSAVNLELALAIARIKMKTPNMIRFAWWAAEEMGLLGSTYYVSQLTQQEKDNIALNINMDMVGSPNFFRGIYNGSMANETIRTASETIEYLFEQVFTERNMPYDLTPFNGRSDYGPFIQNGIPAGGLFTGAEEMKDMPWRTKYGGMANAPLDPCYHQACDTVDNIDVTVLEDMSQALGYVVQTLAMQKDLRGYLNNSTNSN